jgi:tetratricopeptide (TPR) repeat protein
VTEAGVTRRVATILIVGGALALSVSGCAHGGASGGPAAGQPRGAGAKGGTIVLAQDLTDGPAPVAAAWLAFGVSRAASWEEDGAARKGPRVVGYALEVKSRSDLADVWKEQRAGGAAPDPYLDLLLKIRDTGRMREYVISYFSKPGWIVPASDVAALDLPGFERWTKGALAGRNAELLDTTRSTFKPADESQGAGVPGDDLPGPAEIGPKRVPCGRSDAALAAALRRWEAEERALQGLPLAVTSREDLTAVLAKPPAGLALARQGVTLVSPKVGFLFFVAGFCAAEARHPDEAERHLRRAVAVDPMNVDFRGELSFALIGLKRLDEADREVDAGLSLAISDCNRAFFWRKRGYILIDRGNLAEAYRAYAESLKFDPKSDIARKEMSLIVGEIRHKGGYDAKTLKNYEPPPSADEMRVKECPQK